MSATAGAGLSNLGGSSKKSFQIEGAAMLQTLPLHSISCRLFCSVPATAFLILQSVIPDDAILKIQRCDAHLITDVSDGSILF